MDTQSTTNVEQFEQFAERINPRYLNFSPKMTAIVGAIIGYDYGVLDPRGGKLTGLSITFDGFVIASTTSHESGALIGTADELERNLDLWRSELSREDQVTFNALYARKVVDWRTGRAN